jgi:hypothetical protein
MHSNRYIFDLYLQSLEGKENLKMWKEFLDWENWENWEKLDYELLTKNVNSSLHLYQDLDILKKLLSQIWQERIDNLIYDLENPQDKTLEKITKEQFKKNIKNKNKEEILNDAKNYWNEIFSDFEQKNKINKDDLAGILGESIYLTILNPHFFFPYFFVSQFNLIENLFKEFDLILPELPKVRDYKARLNYYIVDGTDGNDGLYHWSGSIETKKSDLQIIYFRTPYSGIGAISNCLSDGYYDPFDYYEGRVVTSNIQTFKFITLQELKENPVWKNEALVKMNMQGVKGQNVTFEDYQELKNTLKSKVENPKILPELENVIMDLNLKLQNERDVELELLEPLLKKLGFSQKYWIRKLPLRMGRGKRNYRDYAFLVNTKNKHEETAKLLWEVKFRIKNQKKLGDAFLQAKSYARRLNSQAFGLCTVEGIWASCLKDEFEFKIIIFFSWKDLKNTEKWSKIKYSFN